MSLDEEWESPPEAPKPSAKPVRAAAKILDDSGMRPTALTRKPDPDARAVGSSADLKKPAVRAEGTTLRELMQGGLLDQHRALMITRGVLEALASIHSGHRRHGDVTPEHVVLMPGLGSDRIKLTDENSKQSDPRYTAPECAFGAADERADIYSVGAVLFELLTGHPPFFADNATEMRRLHAYAPPQTLKQRAPAQTFIDLLEDIVARALAKKRDARYQTATEMIESIDKALTALETAAPPQLQQGEPRHRPNSSLLALAKDLMAQPSAALGQNEPLVPVNVDRRVPELPWTSRAMIMLRRAYARFRALDRKLQIGIASGAGVLFIVLLAVTCGGGSKSSAKGPSAARAAEPAPGAATAPDPAAAGAPQDDRVGASLQKLDRATSCDERRAAIAELADSGDERALPALKKMKSQKCVAKDAAAAIKKIADAVNHP